jgi:hypothetical protein
MILNKTSILLSVLLFWKNCFVILFHFNEYIEFDAK